MILESGNDYVSQSLYFLYNEMRLKVATIFHDDLDSTIIGQIFIEGYIQVLKHFLLHCRRVFSYLYFWHDLVNSHDLVFTTDFDIFETKSRKGRVHRVRARCIFVTNTLYFSFIRL